MTLPRGFWTGPKGQEILRKVNAPPVNHTRREIAEAIGKAHHIDPETILSSAERARNGRLTQKKGVRKTRATPNGTGPTVTMAPLGRGGYLLTIYDGRKTLMFQGHPVQITRTEGG